jgi:hypothetical protein
MRIKGGFYEFVLPPFPQLHCHIPCIVFGKERVLQCRGQRLVVNGQVDNRDILVLKF